MLSAFSQAYEKTVRLQQRWFARACECACAALVMSFSQTLRNAAATKFLLCWLLTALTLSLPHLVVDVYLILASTARHAARTEGGASNMQPFVRWS